MLDSLLATGEGVVVVVASVWRFSKRNTDDEEASKGKTGGIDIRHSEGFREVLGSSWEGD